jgi:hypothetical protein
LPNLPLPKKVVVAHDALWVDGWVFRIFPLRRELLSWLAAQSLRWCKKDASLENKVQLTGMIDAVEALVKKRSDEGIPKQGEFDF